MEIQAQNHKPEKDDTARVGKHDPEVDEEERIEHSKEKNVYANTHSSWYKEMIKKRPNIKKAEKAFHRYFQAHPDKASSLKQRFESWVEQARLYMDKRGYALPRPTAARSASTVTGVAGLTSSTNNTLGSWTMIGPMNMPLDQCSNNNLVTGGYCDRVYVNPYNTNNLFAGFSYGGLWVSTDRGSTWQLTDASFANGTNTYANRDYYYGQIKANPLNSNQVFAATEAGLLKSVNGGVNWTLCTTLNRGSSPDNRPYYLSQAVNDQTTILSTFGQMVYRSTDAGNTWTVVFDNSGGGSNHTFTSQYNFDTPFGLNDRTYNFFGLEADYSTPGHYYLGVWNSDDQACIYQSTDGGATFSLLINLNTRLNSAWDDGTTLCLKTIPSSPSKFFVYQQFITNPPYYKFTSAGTLLDSNTINTYTEAFDIDFTNENTLYQGTYGVTSNKWSGFQRSTNQGTTFNPPASTASGTCNFLHPDIRGISAVGNVVLIADDGGLGLSIDSGATITGTGFGTMATDMGGFSSSRKGDICVAGLDHNYTYIRKNAAAGGWFSVPKGADALVCTVNPYNDSWLYYNSNFGFINKGHLNANGSLAEYTVSPLPDLGSLEFHPYLTGDIYGIQGSDNTILVHSTDNLSTATSFHTFTAAVNMIRIARRNPRTMYVLLNQLNIQRSTDSGATWVDITPSATVSAGQTNITAIDVGKTPGELWAAYGNAQNSAKVLHSTDGGNTWTNMTTATLPTAAVGTIDYQRGTNGGVYISIITGASTTIWYRNNTMTDWQQLGNTLPLMGYIRGRLFVVPAAGKIRFGGSRGAWESPLYESSLPEAGIAADSRRVGCNPADSIQFYDASAYAPGTVSYSWQFPGGSPATSTLQNPKVLYSTPGTYPVTLIVTTPAGSDTATVQNFVYYDSTLCSTLQTDTVAGRMLDLTPSGNPVIYLSPIPINSNTFTVTFWAKPQGLQKAFTQILSTNIPNSYFGIGFAYLGYQPNLNLTFTSNSIPYNRYSNLVLDSTRWNHIALTYTPDSVSLYLNGGTPWTFPKASSSTPSGFPAIDLTEASVALNADIHSQGGNYKGHVDEVCFYNYALSQQQIREKMHLTKVPGTETGLVGYYQFNQYNAGTGTLYDAMGNGTASSASSVAAVNIAPSTAPVASGTSFRIANVTAPGDYLFTGTGVTLHFPGPVVPNGEMVVSRLNSLPDSLPARYRNFAPPYWVIHNWGTNASFTPVTSLQLSAPGINPADTVWHPRLWMRGANALTNTWALLGGATAVASATPDTVTFSTPGITGEGQLFVNDSTSAVQADTVAGKMLDLTPSGDPVISLSPIPLNSNRFTIMLWAKPQGAQWVFSEMLSADAPNSLFGIGFGFPGYKYNLKLTFTSTSIPYQQYSNLTLDSTRWNHIALTYTPDSVSLYLDGGTPWTFPKASSTTPSGFPPIDLSKAPVTVNADNHHQYGNYKGYIDEICFYNYPLSQQEIREKMHLTKVPGAEAGLVGYYQFNQYNPVTDTLYDAMGNGTPSRVAAANITPSTAPVASGKSFRIPNVTAPGDYTFTGTGVTLHFPGPIVPNGEMVVSRLNSLPDSLPAGLGIPGKQYWVIHNWGTNTSFTPMTNLQFSVPGINSNTSSTTVPRLWMRDPNAFLNTWALQCRATSATPASPDTATFNNGCNGTTVGQFYVDLASTTSLVNADDSATRISSNMLESGADSGKFVRIIPNPVKDDEPAVLQNLGRSEATVDLYLPDGRHYRHYVVAPSGTVLIPHLPKGYVFYRATNKDGQKASGVEIVQ